MHTRIFFVYLFKQGGKCTSSTSLVETPASFRQALQGGTVRSIRSWVRLSSLARVSFRFMCLGPDESALQKEKRDKVRKRFSTEPALGDAGERRACLEW